MQKESSTKTIIMKQIGLIKSIISDVGLLMDSNSKTTPSDSILYPDTNGTPRQETWNYQSIIGKLIFLAQNTHLDISVTFAKPQWLYMKWRFNASFATWYTPKIKALFYTQPRIPALICMLMLILQACGIKNIPPYVTTFFPILHFHLLWLPNPLIEQTSEQDNLK